MAWLSLAQVFEATLELEIVSSLLRSARVTNLTDRWIIFKLTPPMGVPYRLALAPGETRQGILPSRFRTRLADPSSEEDLLPAGWFFSLMALPLGRMSET